jgi:hypothetical protein
LGAWLLSAVLLPGTLTAQLEIKSGEAAVFGGGTQQFSVMIHNPQNVEVEGDVRFRLYQAGSSTAAPIGEPHEWRKLRVLPGQTVLETASLDFPALNAKSRLIVQWLNNDNKVLGRTDITVYPSNVLSGLKPLLRGSDLGIWDPTAVLKPSLKQNGVETSDLQDSGLASFQGRLAIIGPNSSADQMPETFARSIESLVTRGVAVVWIQPPPSGKERPKPSFYLVPSGKGAAVLVQPELVANFSDNPKAQESLVQWCAWALNPEPLHLPHLNKQP